MTNSNETSLHLNVGKGRGWKDAFVVVSLAIVLGAFVAQISSSPRYVHLEPITSAPAATAVHG
jgi:hypothetical protein